jgi:adenine-specific DNA-methyltransferase
MPKIDVTRTELVWPGKYDDEGNLVSPRRVNLPLQVIERVNETRATREQREEERAGHVVTLFDYWQAEEEHMADAGDGWRNKLIWGDNLYVMGSLLEHFAGKVDLIYIDPPFATGADFSVTTTIGGERFEKQQSIIEEKAYRDTWGQGIDSYMHIMYARLKLVYELLSDTGSLYLHCDWHIGPYLRIALDEIFGRNNLQNEIVWRRTTARSDSKTYNHVHDVVFLYTKSPDRFIWNRQFTDYDPEQVSKQYRPEEETGRLFQPITLIVPGVRSGSSGKPWRGIDPTARGDHWKYPVEKLEELDLEGCIYWPPTGEIPRLKQYLDEMPGMPLQSIWTDILLSSNAAERTGYATQKPEALLERIVRSSSNDGHLVADFFCGSGTAMAVAEKLGRRWIGCDMSRFAVHVTRKRLMDIPNCRPFEILNLGQYERQVWQGVAFGDQKRPQQMLIFEYLKFILDLYGAQPLPGTQHLHGKKGRAVVHVGAVDAPVTIDEINACLAECQAMGQNELHILGWEWEMGLANLMVGEAKARGIKLLLLTIPREVMEQQALDRGDIQFYELAYLEVDIKPSRKKLSYTVTLTDFVIPNDELIPPEVRAKIKKWSDYVDYWAVDWDFRDDTFVNGWTSYRTRRDRTLQLKTDPHVYDAPGTYRVLVKVIDIFGNDTSQVFEVEVE